MSKKCLTTEQFILNSKKVHGDTYDYSLVKYKNSHTKVKIICKIHGEFSILPYNHTSKKAGCSKCGIIKSRKSWLLSIRPKSFSDSKFEQRANKVHKNKYKYVESSYNNSHSRITIICPIHGEFQQYAHSHLAGFGCKKCSRPKKK